MAQGLLQPQQQPGLLNAYEDVVIEPLPIEYPMDRPPAGSPAYIPPNQEMLEMFPHESTFGQALSGKYIFPMQRHGSTGPVPHEYAKTADSYFGRYDFDTDEIDLNIAPPPPEAYWERRGKHGVGPEGYRVMPAWPTQWEGGEGRRYGYGSLGSGNMGFKTPGRRLEGHHRERVPSFEERREAYRQKMVRTSKHEAAHRYHRGLIGKAEGDRWLEEMGVDKFRAWQKNDPSLSKEDDRKITQWMRTGFRAPDHEVLYLLDWVDAKLRGHKPGMEQAQSWLNRGEEYAIPPLEEGGEYTVGYEREGKEPYDVIAALQPGTPIRDKIERWNDEANERLISEGRPPISNYRDYIDTAIGYTPKTKSSKDRPGERQREREADDSNLLKILQEVGGA